MSFTAENQTPTDAAAGRWPRSSRFDWPLANAAENFLRQQVQSFLNRNSFAQDLAARMLQVTGTDFFEWLDHLVLPGEKAEQLLAIGFQPEAEAEVPSGHASYAHPLATLPRVLLPAHSDPGILTFALRPEHVADFAARQNLMKELEGEPFSRYRRVLISQENGTLLQAVERLGYGGFIPTALTDTELRSRVRARELWHARPRLFSQDAEGIDCARRCLARSIELVGPDVSCHFFFEAERAYWESRNRAAQIQKHRQDRLGLGWGNHDHHTFRSSREHFVDLIEFLLQLGFQRRERYYAGAEAGWGAQILEHPVTGIVVFADVDLMPEETEIDFSKRRLPAAGRLGTVGLWVGLHGESFLEAGMHHLEARFEFEALRDQLQGCGVTTMKPFSDFEFLRQAFTEGERWPVRRERAEKLCSAGLLSRDQCDRFIQEGALGSHLENLQRHGGYKGFNQSSVSAVISATDPRRSHFSGAAATA